MNLGEMALARLASRVDALGVAMHALAITHPQPAALLEELRGALEQATTAHLFDSGSDEETHTTFRATLQTLIAHVEDRQGGETPP